MYAPEAKRLQRCLSAVLNFAKYREDMVAQWQELRDGSRAVAATVAAAKQAHAEKVRRRGDAPRALRCTCVRAALAPRAHLRPALTPRARAALQREELARIAAARAADAPVRACHFARQRRCSPAVAPALCRPVLRR